MGVSINGVVFGPIQSTDKEQIGEVYVLDGFERSLLPEEIVAIDYEYDNNKYIADGISVSYGSYNELRRQMSMAALETPVEVIWEEVEGLAEEESYPQAIYHLLNFADNEGYIGPKAVKELDVYLQEHGDRMLPYFDKYNAAKFVDLRECIKETAAQNGYLEFA